MQVRHTLLYIWVFPVKIKLFEVCRGCTGFTTVAVELQMSFALPLRYYSQDVSKMDIFNSDGLFVGTQGTQVSVPWQDRQLISEETI